MKNNKKTLEKPMMKSETNTLYELMLLKLYNMRTEDSGNEDYWETALDMARNSQYEELENFLALY